jgi:NADH:ubiquinone oxidoreductase subunit 5 (subunit L)/multisubunit Na+/H+ antiporter MnhA subunit
MIILAVGSAVSGFLLVHVFSLEKFLTPVLGSEKSEHVLEPIVVTAIVTVVSVLGVVLAYQQYAKKPIPTTAPVAVSPLTTAARKNLYFDSLNESLLMRPGQYLTRALVFADSRGVDGAVHGLAAGIGGGSGRLRRWQNGFVRSYALSMFGGAALVRGRPARHEDRILMSGTPWLTILGLIPLVGAAVVAALPRGRDLLAKQLTLAISLVVLALTVVMCAAFDPAGDRFQFVQAYDWIPAFGVQYAVGVDGIALVLIALIAGLGPRGPAGRAGTTRTRRRSRPAGVARGSATRTMDAGSDEGPAHSSSPDVGPLVEASARTGGGTAVLERPADDAANPGPVPPAVPPPRRSVKTFFALLLVLETMMIGVFAATDVFLFYVFFEAMLIPMYFIIGSYGGPRRSYAA